MSSDSNEMIEQTIDEDEEYEEDQDRTINELRRKARDTQKNSQMLTNRIAMLDHE